MKRAAFITAAGLLFFWAQPVLSRPPCEPLATNPVKIEAWVSKRYEKDLKVIRGRMAAMGNTRVRLWVYPAENPSRVVAIGRCVPAYIARHALRSALDYSIGAASLVHQGFISGHWIGLGTSLFDENSQKKITEEQLALLLDESLDTAQFQDLYKRLTRQDDKVRAFGLSLDNPKLLEE